MLYVINLLIDTAYGTMDRYGFILESFCNS